MPDCPNALRPEKCELYATVFGSIEALMLPAEMGSTINVAGSTRKGFLLVERRISSISDASSAPSMPRIRFMASLLKACGFNIV